MGDLESIRYNTPFDKISSRVSRSLSYLFGKPSPWIRELIQDRFSLRIRMAKAAFGRDNHMPDGVLNSGTVITMWEEDGEYINFVQPLVGSK
ncbi:hypothetical protein, partial [Staphylococcus saprophyticus]|uniref:hypothetical protein n=1 Tax=Staphylococcus saprophyticus TaxID=29385 RepID=UPI00115C46D2